MDLSPDQIAFEVDNQRCFSREDAKEQVVGAVTKMTAELMFATGGLEAEKIPLYDSNVDATMWDEAVSAQW
jgi:hypothetical protein